MADFANIALLMAAAQRSWDSRAPVLTDPLLNCGLQRHISGALDPELGFDPSTRTGSPLASLAVCALTRGLGEALDHPYPHLRHVDADEIADQVVNFDEMNVESPTGETL